MILPVVSRGLAKQRLSGWSRLVPKIKSLGNQLSSLSDHDLRKQSLALRYRARSGEPLDRLLPEAYAMAREAGSRTLGMMHYDVQLVGGVAMHYGCIAEMQTGEGKTLTATLPLYLAALAGSGAHLATANDYLARRDAEWMQPIYEALGLTVGIIESQMPRTQRQQAYACEVTYGTAKEFGFDFLRDRLLGRQVDDTSRELLGSMLGQLTDNPDERPVQRELSFALVDEADSILIDEARTPLIVSSLPGASQQIAEALYRWSASAAGHFEEGTHFELEHKRREVKISPEGRRLVRKLPHPPLLAEVSMLDLYESIERAIRVNQYYVRDRHYVVRDGEVVIVDEFTGRLAEGRRWRDGMHQAIEAREGVEISVETGDAARVTVQDYFLKYERLGGMTGTAANSDSELRKIYDVGVAKIPTNRPPQRRQLQTRVFGTIDDKWEAIVEEVLEVCNSGRPVLIGTRSIDKSDHLSSLLREVGIEHQVLNARHIAAEAEVVQQAGKPKRVTVATNMAGRGTDVKLEDDVRELGGLHIICSELHESARIDRQLIGRCGRQGDTGTYRQYLALDDEILAGGLGHEKAERLKRLGRKSAGPFDHLSNLFYKAQAKIEREHFRQRRLLLYHEKERRKAQLQMGLDPYLDSIG